MARLAPIDDMKVGHVDLVGLYYQLSGDDCQAVTENGEMLSVLLALERLPEMAQLIQAFG